MQAILDFLLKMAKSIWFWILLAGFGEILTNVSSQTVEDSYITTDLLFIGESYAALAMLLGANEAGRYISSGSLATGYFSSRPIYLLVAQVIGVAFVNIFIVYSLLFSFEVSLLYQKWHPNFSLQTHWPEISQAYLSRLSNSVFMVILVLPLLLVLKGRFAIIVLIMLSIALNGIEKGIEMLYGQKIGEQINYFFPNELIKEIGYFPADWHLAALLTAYLIGLFLLSVVAIPYSFKVKKSNA